MHVASARDGDHVLVISCKISRDPISRPAQLPIKGIVSSLGSASTLAPFVYHLPLIRAIVCVCVCLDDAGLTLAPIQGSLQRTAQYRSAPRGNRIGALVAQGMQTPPLRVSSIPASSLGAEQL